MADIIDMANDQAELILKHQLADVARARPGPVATGVCLFCGEDVEPGRRWCDGDHRDAWEREQRNAT